MQEKLISGLDGPGGMGMASINWLSVEGQVAQSLAEEFDEPIQAKIEALTCEELFYLYKLLQYEPGRNYKVDVFLRVLQNRAKAWLSGKINRPGLPFDWFKNRWQEEFFEFTANSI